VLQPADSTGLNYKKVKCPDIPSWMAAADRIKWVLVNSEAIRGMDYDAYVRRCLQLMMDPKCGGNGWPLAIFFEFDNARRIDQWSTGAPFDSIDPMRVAHFSALAAQAQVVSTNPSSTTSGTNFRSGATSDAGQKRKSDFPRRPKEDWEKNCFEWNRSGHCTKPQPCHYIRSHKCKHCGSAAEGHAPKYCPQNPKFPPPGDVQAQ
jgi:hypothetical protein